MAVPNAVSWHGEEPVSLVDRVAQIARAIPDAPAIEGASELITYDALVDRARRIAGGLARSPGGRGDPVALVFDHDTPAVVAIIAALMAGRPYVALDPAVPPARHRLVLDDLKPASILAQRHHTGLAEEFSASDIPVISFEESLESAPIPQSIDTGTDGVAGVFYTSGTTGRPKGVIRTHRTILHRTMLDAIPGEFGPGDTFSLLYSTSFGTSVNDIFSALLTGGTLAMKDVIRSGVGSLVDWIEDASITVLHTPIALTRRLLDSMGRGRVYPDLRMMIPSGRLYGGDLRRLFSHLGPDAVIVSRYASTETSIVTRLYIDRTMELGDGVVPVGRPLGDKTIRVEGPDGALAGDGETGEIVVSSRFMSPGYWNDTERTESKLTPDPDRPGFHRYRTGDYGRLRPDGLLEFVGRRDERVKIRGYRVEIEDVVTALHALEGVTAAAVRLVDHAGADHLAAYLVLDEDAPSMPWLRGRLAEALPPYMVPSFLVSIDELPLTTAGKVDADALPKIENGRPQLETELVLPRSDREEVIAAIWSDVLEISPIGVHDRFLELGGDSLSAMKVIGRVLSRFGVDLPVRSLMEAGTVEAMEAAVAGLRDARTGRGEPIRRRSSDEGIPATHGQTGIWIAEQMSAGSSAYNMAKVLELDGPLDVEALRESLLAVITRQSALRTTFRLDSSHLTQQLHELDSVDLEIVDLQTAGDAALDPVIEAVTRPPFDLGSELPFRVRLVRTGERRHLLVFVNHHIAGDRQSSVILLDEIAAAYRSLAAGETPDLAGLALEYADYAVWQRTVVPPDELGRQTQFWVETLGPMSGSLAPLVTHGIAGSGEVSRIAFRCGTSVVSELDRTATEHSVSRFVTLLAIVATAVHRVTGRDRLVIGTTVSGRVRPELETIVGYFSNLVAVPIEVGKTDTLGDTLAATGRIVLEALAHADAPFDQVVARVGPERVAGRMPLLDMAMNYGQGVVDEFDFGDVGARRRRLGTNQTRVPLSVNLRDERDGISCELVFDTALVDRDSASRLLEHIRAILESLGSDR